MALAQVMVAEAGGELDQLSLALLEVRLLRCSDQVVFRSVGLVIYMLVLLHPS